MDIQSWQSSASREPQVSSSLKLLSASYMRSVSEKIQNPALSSKTRDNTLPLESHLASLWKQHSGMISSHLLTECGERNSRAFRGFWPHSQPLSKPCLVLGLPWRYRFPMNDTLHPLHSYLSILLLLYLYFNVLILVVVNWDDLWLHPEAKVYSSVVFH